MHIPQPRRPKYLPDYSEMCLRALVERGLAEKISLGGALGCCIISTIELPTM
jgi:hypothetical protein